MASASHLPKLAVLDGGFSTALQQLGKTAIDDDPLWTARFLKTDIDAVKTIHNRFLDSGSDIITTNTYQASVDGFVTHLPDCTEPQAIQLISLAATTAVQCRDQYWERYCAGTASSSVSGTQVARVKPLVAGSVGPYGACLHDGSEYTGSYIDSTDVKTITSWHAARIRALIDGGVDLLALETMPCAAEPVALVQYIAKNYPHIKLWVTMQSQNGTHTSHGESLSDTAELLVQHPQVIGVGVNCVSPGIVETCLGELQGIRDRVRLVVYPNSGELWNKEKHCWYTDPSGNSSPALTFTDDVIRRWITLGGSWIGGCCRVLPEDITRVAAAMDAIRRAQPAPKPSLPRLM